MDEVSLVPNGSAAGASASNQPAKGVKRPAATPDSPGGPMASKRLRKGKQTIFFVNIFTGFFLYFTVGQKI